MTWILPGILVVILMICVLIVALATGVGYQEIENIFYDPFTLLILMAISSAFSLLFFYIAVRFIHERSLLSVITIKSKINWKKFFKGAAIWISILTIFTIIGLLIDPRSYKFTFNPEPFLILVIISLILFPVYGFLAELFFRGYLIQGFGILSKKPIIPLLATSIIYASLHWFNSDVFIFQLLIVINVFIAALMFGIITLGENSIETAAGIHIAHNLYASLIVSTPDTVLGDLPSVFSAPLDASTILWTVSAVLITLTIIFWGKKDKLKDIFL